MDPLSDVAQIDLENIRALAHQRFQEQVIVESVSLPDVYDDIANRSVQGIQASLRCTGVQPSDGVYIGAATLVDIYRMLRQYASAHHGVLDSIYDRNVRKWLGKRAQGVNAGIARTLKDDPESFVAYNNGITIVCRKFTKAPDGLVIEAPQIVNGCQTTRTVYDFMEIQFAGLVDQLDQHPHAAPYRTSLLPFKLIAVEDLYGEFVKNITRYSNKQNAVRGQDFLTLEDDFAHLKQALAQRGYYLGVQTGEYSVLPKAQKAQFPSERLINAFDALRFYAAAVHALPHNAFGRSSEFTPGGREFDTIMAGLTADDLFVPWLIARDAGTLGYSVGAKWHVTDEDHRNQTRYFFAYMFFRVVSQVLRNTPKVDLGTRAQLYADLMRLRDDYQATKTEASPFPRLLKLADQTLATYMALAQQQGWYVDRNSFLKRDELLDEGRLVQASGILLIEQNGLRAQVEAVLDT